MTMEILVRIISEVIISHSPSVGCNKGAHGHTGVIMGTHTDAYIIEGLRLPIAWSMMKADP